ncbi:MAG: DNA adenine methylase [Acetobacter sp.]|nr:DNA adenine methylase [Acetobacter sp.]
MENKSRHILPPAGYIGGKKLLSKLICGMIDSVEHQTYVEPFVGMGGIFFRRKRPVKNEVINDFNGDIANLFRVLQRHFVALQDMLRWQVTSREHFERLRETPAASLTDLERAVRFLYVQRLSFSGKVKDRSFNRSGGSARFDVIKLIPDLEAVHERLSSVVIECLPYQDVLKRYDRENVLFYLDPPYWGTEDYYDAPFSRADFEILSVALRSLQGAFFLSLNDCGGVRETFHGFHMKEVSTRYADRTKGGSGKVRDELIISNRPFDCQ